MVAAGFPITRASLRRQAYMDYYENIGHVLPCRKCRRHYLAMVRQMKKNQTYTNQFETRRTVQKMVFDIHNKINKRLGKPQASQAVLDVYINKVEQLYRASC